METLKAAFCPSPARPWEGTVQTIWCSLGFAMEISPLARWLGREGLEVSVPGSEVALRLHDLTEGGVAIATGERALAFDRHAGAEEEHLDFDLERRLAFEL